MIQKNMLEYLKIMKSELIDMFFNPSAIKEINNANYKGYLKEKLEMKLEKDLHCVNTNRDSVKKKKKKY